MPLYVLNEIIKLNGINYFGKKVLIKEANSQENFNATKHHRFNFSHVPQHVVIDIQKENITSERRKLAPGSQFYAEISTSPPNRNERIAISGDSITFDRTIKQNIN